MSQDEPAPASAPALTGNSNNNNNGGSSLLLRPRLRREHVLSPITALAFHSTTASPDEARHQTDTAPHRLLLLAGEDTDIGIYDAETAVPRGRLRRVFRAQPVHGIAVSTTISSSSSRGAGAGAGAGGILVWGGRSVTVLSPDLIEAAVDGDVDLGSGGGNDDVEAQSYLPVLPREATAPDWILDGAISPFDGTHVALLTAHNEIVEARVTRSGSSEGEGDTTAIAFGAVRSPSRPILYSGNVRWVAADRVLVAAGTVFGEILVWKCGGLGAKEGGGGDGGDCCEVLFVFSGHEGSIFGVHISPAMPGVSGGTTTTRLLASCSDDRTVRIWDITEDDRASSSPADGYGRGDARARQTGFGDSVEASLLGPDGEGDGTPGRCLAVAMGHLSRIWRVEFAPQGRRSTPLASGVDIYSFGEDATAQKWRLNFNDARGIPQQQSSAEDAAHANRHKAALTHRATYANHSGKQIWAQAIRASERRRGFVIATGGADGKIALVEDGSDDSQELVTDDSPATEEVQHGAEADSGRMVSFALGDLSKACVPPQDAAGVLDGGAKSTANFPKSKNAREGFQRYAFIREDRLLVVTSFGRLFLGTFGGGGGSGSGIRWAQIPLPEETSRAIFSYSVLRSSRSSPLAFVGTTSGELYYYDDDDAHSDAKAGPSLRPMTRVHGKVADIFCLSRDIAPTADQVNNGVTGAPRAEILVTVLGSTRAVLMQLSDDARATPGEVEVTLEPGFSVTAAAFFRGYLVLGSRNGSICVLGKDDAADAAGGYSTRFTLRVKLDDAITSIVPLPQNREQQQEAEEEEEGKQESLSYSFLATCRDGKYRIYELHTTTNITTSTSTTTTTTATTTTTTTTSDHVRLHLLHEVALRSGSVIEGAWFSINGRGHGHDLMVCGFRGKNLVVWNETSRREVASVECGGGHRSFTYTPLRRHRQLDNGHYGNDDGNDDDDGEGFRFVFTKASRMHVFSQAGAAQRTLKPGGHGREIKAASASPSGRYVATGAEDTTIRIWERQQPQPGDSGGGDSGTPGFRCVAVLEKHATGIQALRWHGDGHLFSSGGSEEFFVWRVRRIPGCAACPLGVVCEAAFPDRSEAGDLRIMDFDVERIPPPSQQHQKLHEDAVMGAPEDPEAVFRISMALSNSTLQFYTYTRTGGFALQSRRGYTGACLTQLRHLEAGSTGAVLTAATDGHLAIFGGEAVPTSLPTSSPHSAAKVAAAAGDEEKEENSDIAVARIHQNSVKSLDLRSVAMPEGGMAYLVVTGGDDNALGVTCLRSDSTAVVSGTRDTAAHSQARVQSKAIVRSAHAAAVTGIAILRLLEDGRDALVVTASTDQRVKTWRLVGWQSPDLRIVLLDDCYSAVADSGDLEVLDNDRVLVVGVGMEVWKVP